MRFLGTRWARAAAAALLAALAAWTALPAPPAWAGGTVRIGKLLVDPAPRSFVSENAEVAFRTSGSFSPGQGHDEDEQPWVGFLWDFGDGTATVNDGPKFGKGTQTSEVRHTFTAAGEYTVQCTAYHGYDLFGFKFYKRRQFKVRVQCEGYDLGPKKCGKSLFDSFTGTWASSSAITGRPDASVAFALPNRKGQVTGVLTYQGDAGPVSIQLKGGAPLVARTFGSGWAVVLKGTAPWTYGAVQGSLKWQATLLTKSTPQTYRQLYLILDGLPGNGTNTSGSREAPWRLTSRPFAAEARLCTTLGASVGRLKPGEEAAVSFAIQNVGLAGIPSNRLLVTATVEGGAIVTDKAFGDGMEISAAQADQTIFVVGSLGEGKDQDYDDEDGGLIGRPRLAHLARGTVVVKASNGSTNVKVLVSVLDVGAPQDQLVTVVNAGNRGICIPVLQPDNPASR